MRILIEFNPDELMRGVETGTLQALFEAIKVAERQIETAAQAANKPILTDQPAIIPAPAPVTIPTAAPAEQTAAAPQTAASPVIAPTMPPVTAPPVAPSAAPTTAPTATPQYDFNQLASATMQLQQAGQNIFEIFSQFGIQALNQLPKERYAEYAAVLRLRGAKI